MTRLRVGLIGLGSVAQVVHLPVLRELQEEYELVAGCDLSQGFTDAVAARHGIPRVYASEREMLAAERLDLVAVLNSDEYHAHSTIAALEAGCHVLLEKPASLTLRDVDAMIDARERSGREVMVGYMRRHAGAYLELQRQLTPRPDIHHLAVRDIIGPNSYFIGQSARVIAPFGFTPAAAEEKAARARAQVLESIGHENEALAGVFRLLSGLSSHDLSAMRGLVGTPRRVIAAGARRNGRFISALFDYGSFIATFETGVDMVGRFDASIEVFAGDRRLRLEYDTPYIRQLPTRLLVAETIGEAYREAAIRPSFRDPYTTQWLALHTHLTQNLPVAATLEDASEDIRLAIAITAEIARDAARS